MDTIYIRADMNPTIATGHVMRCLSIADAVREQGKEVKFIVADEYPLELLEKRGYRAEVLYTDWKNMESELPILRTLIRENKVEKMLIDSYQVTQEYLNELQKNIQVFYLDDLDQFQYPVSAVICYANYWKRFSYGSYNNDTQFYLGAKYMPLRKVFQKCPQKEIKEKAERILVLSGGTDSYHILENIVELFKDNVNIEVDIICGAYYFDFEELYDKYHTYTNLHFYKNVGNLDQFMKSADIAISAGGTTLYELSAAGTPTISYSFADNQLFNVQQFQEDGLIEYAGDVRYDDIYKNIMMLYQKYDKNIELRKRYSMKMQELIDGRGAERIANILALI